METPSTKPQRKGSRNTPPAGPITKAVREERMRFVINTFSNCMGEELQILAIEREFKIKRIQAKRYLDDAKTILHEQYTEYQKDFAQDAFLFLMRIRQDTSVRPADRISAQKELREVFGPVREIKVSGVGPSILVATQVNLLANEKALEAALMLEAALAQSHPHALNETQEKALGEAVGDSQ